MSTSDTATAAGEVYRRYQQEFRDFIAVMTRCWLKGWPDRKDAIDDCRRVALAYADQALVRLDYLLRNNLLQLSTCGSLGDIHKRLFDKWSEAEEAALMASNPAYKDSVSAREAAQARIAPDDTDGPARMAKSDPEFIKAASDLNDRAWALNEELKKLVASSPAPRQ